MKIIVKLRWSEGDDKWHMLLPPKDSFVYDFYDCENFNRIFDSPNKKIDELFVVDIHRYGKEKKEESHVERL